MSATPGPPAFNSHALRNGMLADYSTDEFPTHLHAWSAGALELGAEATHFGFVQREPAELHCASGRFTAAPGMYFSVPGPLRIGGAGSGIVISRLGQQGFFHLGGPIEKQGRLRYIDGCTDSLLIAPVTRGEACLNLLHLPAGTRQSRHTHPSIRMGLIISGSGHCVTPEARIPLSPGLAFVIHARGTHSFHTDSSPLLVLAYHPDSDFGPTHENHPMVNRTHLESRTLQP